MALTLNITDHWSDTKRLHVIGNLVASGNYVAGGDIIPFNNPLIKTSLPPVYVDIQVYSSTGVSTYTYAFKAGTTLANQKMIIFTTTGGLELAAGAYPAPVINNPAAVYAIFHKFI